MRLRRTYAFAQILFVEPELDVLHVAVGVLARPLRFTIGHVPIVTRYFESSITRRFDIDPHLPLDMDILRQWQAEQASGVAGAFNVTLSRAVSYIWATASVDDPTVRLDNTFIDYGYPRRGDSGKFSTVRVRITEIAASGTTPSL